MECELSNSEGGEVGVGGSSDGGIEGEQKSSPVGECARTQFAVLSREDMNSRTASVVDVYSVMSPV
jgi:hypothetical protein